VSTAAVVGERNPHHWAKLELYERKLHQNQVSTTG